MKIENIMNKKILTLSMDSPLSKAKELFENNKFHHLIILDDEGILIGVITDRDLYKNLSPTIGTSQETHKDTALMQKKIHQIMKRNLITARSQQTLSEAAALLYEHHVSCLPIINEQHKPIGIVTWRDLLKVWALKYKKRLATG